MPPASVAAPVESLFQFDPLEPVPQAPPALDVRPARSEGKAKVGPRENLDLGFSLELEGDAQVPSPGTPAALPFPSARVANEGSPEAPASDEEVPALAPPSARPATSARALRPVAKRLVIPRWAFWVAGGVALAVVAALVLVPLLRSAPSPETVLKPFETELAKDRPSSYRKAVDQLDRTATSYKEGGVKLQVKAAELLLTVDTVHGGPAAELARAEQLLQGAAGKAKLEPVLGRARALLAVAKGKPREAEAALTDRAAPESQLVLGLAALAQGKAPTAADAFRRYVAARPNHTVGHYLLGKALLATANAEARKHFEAVLAQNPAHAGAMIALAGLEETPDKRLTAAVALVERKELAAGPIELADLYVTMGLAAQALGRTPIAIDAFSKAMTYDKQRTVAVIALGESLLYEGKYAVAMERLKTGGPAVEATPAGKFCLGGAFIATGEVARGLALVTAASKERPDDPRGPFWTGFAAHVKQPPDFSAAEQGYRDAIKRNAKFLPASLKLAALLQQQNQAEESLTVLRAAEEAGAPPAVLQLAWGEALIVAKEPAKAEEVFQRALDNDPKSVSARLGVAAALEAQGKLAEARVSLENSLKAAPETIGLRERLAQVCLKLGEKDQAMVHFQDELRIHATIGLHLAVARLALEVGKIELAQSEAKKVLDESPRNAEAAYDLARVHEARHDSGAALQEYRRATTWGNTPLFALGYGQLLDKVGKQSEALASFANAVALPAGRMERGRIYFRNGDLEGALGDFQAAAKMMPDAAEPLILQGLCYDKLGDGKKAEAAWRASLKVDPDAPEPHYRLGRTELDHGKPAAAIENLRKATAKVPDDADWRADLYFQLAQAELLTGAKPAALSDFKKFLDIAPANAPTRPEATDQVARLSGGKRVLK
jgi:tetratricopeptide (TPR) repeat protein